MSVVGRGVRTLFKYHNLDSASSMHKKPANLSPLSSDLYCYSNAAVLGESNRCAQPVNSLVQSGNTRTEESAEVNTTEITLASFDAFFDSPVYGLFIFDNNGTTLKFNQTGFDLLGIEQIQSCQDFRKQLMDRVSDKQQLQSVFDRLLEFPLEPVDGLLHTTQNQYISFESRAQKIDGVYSGRLWTFRDETLAQQNAQALRMRADYDSLTQLHNRDYVVQYINALLDADVKKALAVFFIDLDDFKRINDNAGHEVGNQCLKHFSQQLQSCFTDGPVLARYGGDEFVVVAQLNNIAQAERLCHSLLEKLKKPVNFDSNQFVLTASIGVVWHNHCERVDGADVLIHRADVAMYAAKAEGKKHHKVYCAALEQAAGQEAFIESQIVEALEANTFRLHFQPKISLKTQMVESVEALIRWPSTNAQWLYLPDDFIPVAERSKLIEKITSWVIKDVCRQIKLWQGTWMQDVAVSINISAKDLLRVNFVAEVASELEANGMIGSNLIFEVTESLLIESIDKVATQIARLRRLGIRFALDDFGTGYSSFKLLQVLEIDYLKFDRSFLVNLSESPTQHAITKSIIDLANNLGIITVAEGVESLAELDVLKDLGCDKAQGLFYCEPLPADKLLNFSLHH